MSAVARLWWTYFTLFPIQRWIGVIAAASLLFALLFPGPFTFFVLLVPVVIFLFTTVSLIGFLLRRLSSPRTHRFLPHFRSKMLAGLLSTIVTVLLPWFIVWIIAPAQAVPSGWGFAFPVAIVSTVVLGTFVMAGSMVRGLLILPALFVVDRVPVVVPALFADAGVQLPLTIGVLCAATWLAFGIWYWRVPRIAPADWLRPNSRLQHFDSLFDKREALTRDKAGGVYLTGRFPKRTLYRLLPAAIVVPSGFAIGNFWADPLPTPALLLGVPILLLFMNIILANRIARRARLLWLKRGHSRADSFLESERETQRMYFWNAIVTALWLSGLAYPELQWHALLWAFAFCLTGGAFACYLGLMHTRGFKPLDVAAIGALTVSVGVAVAAMFLETLPLNTALAVLAFHIAGAWGCRAVSRRRWEQIDWLVFRPLRLPFQGMRERS